MDNKVQELILISSNESKLDSEERKKVAYEILDGTYADELKLNACKCIVENKKSTPSEIESALRIIEHTLEASKVDIGEVIVKTTREYLDQEAIPHFKRQQAAHIVTSLGNYGFNIKDIQIPNIINLALEYCVEPTRVVTSVPDLFIAEPLEVIASIEYILDSYDYSGFFCSVSKIVSSEYVNFFDPDFLIGLMDRCIDFVECTDFIEGIDFAQDLDFADKIFHSLYALSEVTGRKAVSYLTNSLHIQLGKFINSSEFKRKDSKVIDILNNIWVHTKFYRGLKYGDTLLAFQNKIDVFKKVVATADQIYELKRELELISKTRTDMKHLAIQMKEYITRNII